jgi:hypothetical protein
VTLVVIDPKALEHACLCAGRAVHHFDLMGDDLPLRASIIAHARAIEQHEAFRQEVSDALSVYHKADGVEERSRIWDALTRFIIPKPVDPLVEAWKQQYPNDPLPEASCANLRAAMLARGYEFTKIGEEGDDL